MIKVKTKIELYSDAVDDSVNDVINNAIFHNALFRYLLIILILFSVFFSSYFSVLAQDASPAYPVSICEPAALIEEARNFYRQKDYIGAINRIESIFYINKNLPADLDEMLIDALARQLETELAASNYKNAASYNIKIMALKHNFDFIWLNKLLNIYMLSGNYRKTHELCLEILKKQGLLALDNPALAKIYAKLSVVYATFRDSAKSFDSLIEAALREADIKAIKSYTSMIFPAHLNSKLLLEHAVSLADKNKIKEAYAAAYIYSRTAEKPDASVDELLSGLISKDASLESMFTVSEESATGEVIAMQGLAAVKDKNALWQNEADTSMVVLSNVPARLKNDRAVMQKTSHSGAGGEMEMIILRADELFEKRKFEDALAEYEKARPLAGEELKKEIDRKIFSAYWHSKEDYIKLAAYTFILIIMAVLFYYFNPASFFNKEQYSLISVSKTLKSGVELVRDKKYQKAINELEKIVDMKLSATETVALFLNLGVAYYYINSFANSLMAFKKVLQYDYENIESYKYLARIYIKTKDRSFKAIEVFNFLISKKMADLEMLKAVLNYNVSQNSIDEAGVQIAGDILSAEPANEAAGRFVVKYFSKVKRFDDEALRFIEKYIESYPRDIDSRIIYLETLYRRKDYKKIASECGVLFTYACDNILIHSIFIDSIVNLNKPQMLITEYERLYRENPGSIITNFIHQSLRSLIVDKKSSPQADYALAVRVNFNVCHKCFHLNLNEFNNCQRCGSALKI